MKRAAAIVIVAVALAAMGPALVRGEIFTLRDHTGYFQPLRWFTAQELRAGHLPLWNPYSASGEPWLANPQTGVFYPPSWIFIVLPFATAYVLYLLLHAILLGWGAFALFARRVSQPAALAGAVALMVCGPVLSLVDVGNNFTTMAWLPLVLWCAISNASPRLSALVIAMSFLAGEPFFAALGALAFALLRWRTPRATAITALGALGLSAVQLLPFVEWVRGSDRAGSTGAEAMLRESMPPRDWLRLFVPPHLTTRGIVDPNLHQHFLPIVYCGVVTLILALLALATSWRRRDVQVALGAIALTMLLAAGPSWLFVHLPLQVLRYPARLVVLAAMAIALLAAVGWEWVAAKVTWRWLVCVVVAAIAIDGLVRCAPLFVSAPFQTNIPHSSIVGRDGKFLRVGETTYLDRGAWIDGYLNIFERRMDAGTAAPLINARYAALYERALAGGRIEPLDALAIRYLLAERLGRPFVAIESSRGVTVYRNPHFPPLAYFRGDDGRMSSVVFLSFGTSFARTGVDAPSSGAVILSQQDAPGWDVAVDGKPSRETARVGGVFRSVRVTPGRHIIEWTYRPLSLRIGAAMTFIALVWMLFGGRAMRPSRAFVKR